MTGTEAEAVSEPISGKPLTWPFVALLAVFYLLCVVITTYPTIREMGTTIPEPADPLNHLWVLRWNKQCLLEGKLPFVCPEIQYPVGAPLGNNPSLILHSLIFVPLSMVFDNDVFTYNFMWFGAFVFTGLGTFALAWVLLRERLERRHGRAPGDDEWPHDVQQPRLDREHHDGCLPHLRRLLDALDRPALSRPICRRAGQLLPAGDHCALLGRLRRLPRLALRPLEPVSRGSARLPSMAAEPVLPAWPASPSWQWPNWP